MRYVSPVYFVQYLSYMCMAIDANCYREEIKLETPHPTPTRAWSICNQSFVHFIFSRCFVTEVWVLNFSVQ